MSDTNKAGEDVSQVEILKLYEQISEYVKFTPQLKNIMVVDGDLANEPILHNILKYFVNKEYREIR